MALRTLPAPAPAAHLSLVPPGELAARASTLAARLRADGMDGAFLLHPSSGFWLTGTLAQAWPFLDAGGTAALPVRASVGRAAAESPLPQAPVRSARQLPGALADLGATVGKRLGVETDVVPAAELDRLREAFPGAELVDCSLAVRETRAVKSPYEIEWIERGGAIVSRAMDAVIAGHIRPGVTELELMSVMEGTMRADGHQGVVRMRRWNLEMHYGTVSVGESACYPCYFDGPDGQEALYPAVQQGGGRRAVEPHRTVLVDFVGAAGGYLADRSRIFCVGKPPREAVEAHDFCREMLAAIVERLRPGIAPSEIHADVTAMAEKTPWADRFMGWGENRVGFLGHGIGLDLDELPVIAPRFDAPLVAGNVIAVEPKVFLGGVGAVGVENTYVVTETGCRDVTPGPEEIRVLPPGGGA